MRTWPTTTFASIVLLCNPLSISSLPTSSLGVSKLARNFGSSRIRSVASRTFEMSSPLPGSLSTEAVKRGPRVLSVQSHTVHGYVGNKAATLPLQCLGFNVDVINTVTLSNHPGYAGGAKGQGLDPAIFKDIISGLEANNLLTYDILLTGYIRSVDMMEHISQLIGSIKATNSDSLIVCDPVLGDNGRYYVPEALKDMYLSKVIPSATVVTPNQFEAEVLTGVKVDGLASARQACEAFHLLGVKICVLKGVKCSDNKYSIFVSTKLSDEQPMQMFQVDIPLVSSRLFSGCGDLFTSLVTGMLYKHVTKPSNFASNQLCFVIEEVSQVMLDVLKMTVALDSKELSIVESLPSFVELKSKAPALTPSLVALPSTSDATYSNKHVHSFRAHRVFAPVNGVIFDMDGTLTKPGAIDFSAMYQRVGVDRSKGDIILQVEAMTDASARQRAYEIILEEEMKGIERMELRDSLRDLLDILYRNRIRTAISTRNCDVALTRFVEAASIDHYRIHPLLHRHSLEGNINKPDARVAQHILDSWDAAHDPSTVWFVGDSLDDMLCGKAAGCRTCLIRTDANSNIANGARSDVIDVVVDSLVEFAAHAGLQ